MCGQNFSNLARQMNVLSSWNQNGRPLGLRALLLSSGLPCLASECKYKKAEEIMVVSNLLTNQSSKYNSVFLHTSQFKCDIVVEITSGNVSLSCDVSSWAQILQTSSF